MGEKVVSAERRQVWRSRIEEIVGANADVDNRVDYDALVEARRREQEPRRRATRPGRAEREADIEAFFASLPDPAVAEGRCSGWEIDEAAYEGRGQWTVKLGIYPWRKTIDTGTNDDWRAFVEDVLEQIDEGISCPGCGKQQSARLVDEAGWRCDCGARFFVRHAYVANSGITGADVWPALRWALLHAGTDYRQAKGAVEAVEGGAALADVFAGAGSIEVLNATVYYLTAGARPKEPGEMPAEVVLEFALGDLGLAYVTSTWTRYRGAEPDEWYEATIGGQEIVVLEEHLGPGEDEGRDLQVGIRHGADLVASGLDTEDWDASDDLWEAFADFLPRTHGEWEVHDNLVACGAAMLSLGAVHTGGLPQFSTIAEATAWLKGALAEAVEACIAEATAFREQSSDLVAAWRDRRARAAEEREQAERVARELARRSEQAWTRLAGPYLIGSCRAGRSSASRIVLGPSRCSKRSARATQTRKLRTSFTTTGPGSSSPVDCWPS